ncbi:MAG TPA: orotate phosphoribosyltransferase [Steroidobacteraceae bacterium]|jgi:orotate phosphoribosyltransferase|nr:orotate phosphoribosyltransferase [Steroidobacteraceae bacterium]
MQDYQLTFIDLALSRQALRFGRFTLKSGRESPYFFNAGLFSDGEAIATLGRCYAAAIARLAPAFDVLFGPAYKGIPLAAATAAALFEHHGRNIPYAFNRKEPKDHGEGGTVIGTPLRGRVLVIDDVVTAGTAVRESLALIRQQGAQPAGVVFALDRQERGQGALSATQEIASEHGIPCVSVVTLADLIEALSRPQDGPSAISDDQLTLLKAYRQRYGVS